MEHVGFVTYKEGYCSHCLLRFIFIILNYGNVVIWEF